MSRKETGYRPECDRTRNRSESHRRSPSEEYLRHKRQFDAQPFNRLVRWLHMAGGAPYGIASMTLSLLRVARPSQNLGMVRKLNLLPHCSSRFIISSRNLARTRPFADCVHPRTLCPTRKGCGTPQCKCNYRNKTKATSSPTNCEVYFALAARPPQMPSDSILD